MLPTTKQLRNVVNLVLNSYELKATHTYTDITSEKKTPNKRRVKYWNLRISEIDLIEIAKECNIKLREMGLEETVKANYYCGEGQLAWYCASLNCVGIINTTI